MEYSPWEAHSRSDFVEEKCNFSIHDSPPLDPILSQRAEALI
jgi:hypothetical protein